ncbi:OmpP1/FadL family transporter [Desulfosediminicola ganghwensis]|uniref:OmpP1/FadL family transporter n=1 Tax=Desulfosediminicola ganghwensis TaxID=2569540 RepID=UPI0010AD8B9E|nr:OmpP1/FadL family transporter [Desulfosediminicola ganghwensis]
MKKVLSVVALASLFGATSVMASGFRIPEQSVDSTAKAGANIASADKADAAYFNPAIMNLMEDTWHVEADLSYIYLSEIDYEGTAGEAPYPLPIDTSSEREHFFVPTLFVVSPDYNGFRFGFASVAPFGLAKRWREDPYAKALSSRFSLQVIELNPTVSYAFNEMFSIAGGVRMTYSKATVINEGFAVPPGSRYLDGDTVDWGYNLAANFKPNKDWNFAVTYRSNIDLDFEDGDTEITINPEITEGDVTVSTPGVLSFSAAYTYDKWTFDLTVDQTQWSEYESLDFTYNNATGDSYYDKFNLSVKDWDDTWAIRLGVEYELNPQVTLMGGIAYDENPVPEETASFELPDSDAWLFSAGARYAYSDNMEFGLAILYDYKEERTFSNESVDGEFSNASAFLVTAGLSYKF